MRQTRRVRHIHVIGIGSGDPDQLTLQAVKALRATDVFFLLDKGERKTDLSGLRKGILDTHLPDPSAYRVVEARDPERARESDGAAYSAAVDDWRTRRADIYARMITDELGEDGTGAFLVWGDPSLYDSTFGILEAVLARGGVEFTYDVVPGISSVSALAARHRIGLNRVARPVQITTGRLLAAGFPEGVDDVVVMLDAQQAFRHHVPSGSEDGAEGGTDDRADGSGGDGGMDIYWGAYIGTPDEILISGPLAEAGPRIERVRAEARERKGWIMDTYLLRRNPDGQQGRGDTGR